MLFSIIVPAYNAASFIDNCVGSVLGQTYPAFELILVDDGSQDDTLSVCRAYAEADPRIKVIHKENGGHTSARNAGLEMASGEYVLFLDSDDWLANRTLEQCHKEIMTHGVDVVIFRMENAGDSTPYPMLIGDGCYPVCRLEQAAHSSLIIGADGRFLCPKSLSAKCFRRDVIAKSQLEVPQDIRVGEDGAAFVGAMIGARTVSVIAEDTDACYYCLVRADSVSRSADADAFRKATLLLMFYHRFLAESDRDYSQQFYRCVVAQLYTAALLVIRSGGKSGELNRGLDEALSSPVISHAFKKATFNLKGYRYIIKKFILRHRLWRFAKWIDG